MLDMNNTGVDLSKPLSKIRHATRGIITMTIAGHIKWIHYNS